MLLYYVVDMFWEQSNWCSKQSQTSLCVKRKKVSSSKTNNKELVIRRDCSYQVYYKQCPTRKHLSSW